MATLTNKLGLFGEYGCSNAEVKSGSRRTKGGVQETQKREVEFVHCEPFIVFFRDGSEDGLPSYIKAKLMLWN